MDAERPKKTQIATTNPMGLVSEMKTVKIIIAEIGMGNKKKQIGTNYNLID